MVSDRISHRRGAVGSRSRKRDNAALKTYSYLRASNLSEQVGVQRYRMEDPAFRPFRTG
jgi:hypothetical protein